MERSILQTMSHNSNQDSVKGEYVQSLQGNNKNE